VVRSVMLRQQPDAAMTRFGGGEGGKPCGLKGRVDNKAGRELRWCFVQER